MNADETDYFWINARLKQIINHEIEYMHLLHEELTGLILEIVLWSLQIELGHGFLGKSSIKPRITELRKKDLKSNSH